MSNYLSRLKQLDDGKNSHNTPDTVLTKLTEGTCVSNVSSYMGHIEKKIIATEAQTVTHTNERIADTELFTFNPPGDPVNDDEALQERVAIMMEGNGWDEATALREARWDADRGRCWRGFLLNAKRILSAPRAQREALLGRYRREANERYGEATAANMAMSMAAWITEKHTALETLQ